MIVVQIKEGLGNQMFQYALGRALSVRNGTELKLDITGYRDNNLRQYGLYHFNIKADFAAPGEIYVKPRVYQVKDYLMYKIRKKYCPWHMQKSIREKKYQYDADILKVKDNVYIKGWWQSVKYFEDVSGIIRDEFTLKNEPDRMNREVLEKIDSVNSVSLHVRRGDYITNPLFDALSLDYYSGAVDLLASKVKEPRIFVFSDDIPWCKESLRISLPVYFMEHNGEKNDYEDLRLMSRCKHHIISNSTFSWWGAWLSTSPGKIVIAPHKWNNRSDAERTDIVPEEWIKI